MGEDNGEINMTKLGFLSCEYVVGDQSYWLQSAFDNPKDGSRFSFRVIPTSAFPAPLRVNHIILEADYSEITPFDDEGAVKYLFATSQSDIPAPIDIDIKSFPKLGWNETFDELVKVGVPLSDLQGFWHQHLVRANSGAPEWVKRDFNYQIMAWLPDTERLYCVIGEDYSRENPNMVTVHCGDTDFVERLKWFRVYAIRFSAKDNEYHLV